MPDWSYRTLFQPFLLQLPVGIARTVALGGIGLLARLPGGVRIIDLFGHMRPDAELSMTKRGLTFPSRVGLGHVIDPAGGSLAAMSRFGFACIEVGPLNDSLPTDQIQSEFHPRQRTFLTGELGVTLRSLVGNLRVRSLDIPPVLLRIPLNRWGKPGEQDSPEYRALGELASLVDGVVLDAGDGGTLEWIPLFKQALPGKPLLWRHSADELLAPDLEDRFECGTLAGIVVDEPRHLRSVDSSVRSPPPLERVRAIRQQVGNDLLLIARGGVIDPQDALDLYDAGADVVLIDDGLIFSGPGLSKRINEACLSRLPVPIGDTVGSHKGPQSWIWTLLLGVSLFGGGWLALVIALSRVMLPYDESFVGMNREQLCGVNPRLVDFMCHDRVTLAGTMISLGLCYSLLSIYGSRRGRHWAQVAILASSFVGFFSFFAFLGYGYFDPFHAFVAAILFQLTLFGLATPLSPVHDRVTPTLHEDQTWRLAQWGQLLLIAHAVALCTAGLVIVGIGSTCVFVMEDLEFMQTTVDAISSANPRIIPLVAHDRASFGGMLLSCGLATLLPALWGFERGRPWLWWMLAGAGLAGYLPAIGVHYAVGYTSSWHLAPAFGGALVLLLGLALSRSFLCDNSARRS